MPRLYLPLVPVALLAVVAAASACSRGRVGEEGDTLRVVPPPAAYFTASAPSPELHAAAVAPADPAPSAEEVREFEAPVHK